MSYEPIKTFAPRRYLSLSDEEVFFRAEQLMNQQEIYRDPYLTLDALAAEINVSRHVLSRVINTSAGVHFQLWVGGYRIAEAQRVLINKDSTVLKMTELAKLVGFPSRTSFYRMFRRITDKSPSALLGKDKKVGETEKYAEKR